MIPQFLQTKFNQIKLFLRTPPPDKYTLSLWHILNKSPDIGKLTYIKRLDDRGQLICDAVRANFVKGVNIEVSWQNEVALDITNVKPIEDLENGCWRLIAKQIGDALDKQILWFCITDKDMKTKVIGLMPGTSNYFVLSYI